jgi:hypothetical protein
MKTLLAAIGGSEEGGTSVREMLARALFQRRHAYVDFISGPGIQFYTIRGERIEPYTTIRVNP